jgi:hypothetical protein
LTTALAYLLGIEIVEEGLRVAAGLDVLQVTGAVKIAARSSAASFLRSQS